jgi:hypothetical protein
MKILLLLSLTCASSILWGAETPGTIYQYKKYEKFDLGSLDLNGELLAPGDISVRERERNRIKLDLFDRKIMRDLKKLDAESIN